MIYTTTLAIDGTGFMSEAYTQINGFLPSLIPIFTTIAGIFLALYLISVFIDILYNHTIESNVEKDNFDIDNDGGGRV
jgi:hypothetical protein